MRKETAAIQAIPRIQPGKATTTIPNRRHWMTGRNLQ